MLISRVLSTNLVGFLISCFFRAMWIRDMKNVFLIVGFTCVLEGLDLGFAAGMPFEKFSRTETETKCALKVFAKCALDKTNSF